MTADFNALSDDEFSLAWLHLSDRERSAIDPAQLAECVDRYRRLSPYNPERLTRPHNGHERSEVWQPPQPRKRNDDEPQIELVDAKDIATTPRDWLKWPILAIGKITSIVGDPEVGKSTLTAALIAQITSGQGTWPFPDKTSRTGDVVVLAAEDDIGDTWNPRLEAAGADMDRVAFVQSVMEKDARGRRTRRMVALNRDLDLLASAIREKKPGTVLVVFDPLSAYFGERTDSHNDAAVKRVLSLVADFAVRLRVAVLAIAHFNKTTNAKALYRIAGSIAMVGNAQATYAVLYDPQDVNHERRLVLRVKNNLCKERGGLAYSVAQSPRFEDIGYAVIEDDPVCDDVDEVLRAAAAANTDTRSVVDDCAAWFLKYVEATPLQQVRSTEAEAAAKDAGYSRTSFVRARAVLKTHGLISRKSPATGEWFLMLK